MQIGVRQIRTSGKGSGSIEVTLPTELRDFVGLPCRVLLRDGRQPHIVLQPEMQHVHAVFARLWCALAGALLPGRHDLTSMASGAFAYAVQPRGGAGDLPVLCWRDGLMLAGPAPHAAEGVSRMIAAMAEALAGELGVEASLARGFGMACGYLAVGVPPGAEAQEVCEIAADGLRGKVRPGAGRAALEQDAEGALGEAFWRAATPGLGAVAALFAAWSADPAGLSDLRVAWRRGVSIEMNGG